MTGAGGRSPQADAAEAGLPSDSLSGVPPELWVTSRMEARSLRNPVGGSSLLCLTGSRTSEEARSLSAAVLISGLEDLLCSAGCSKGSSSSSVATTGAERQWDRPEAACCGDSS